MEATNLSAAMTSYQSATLQWVVPYIAYDQEFYTVRYSINTSLFNQATAQVSGVSDLSQNNTVLTVQLTGLTHNTTYYYQVISSNSHGSTESAVASFLTVPLRELIIHVLHGYIHVPLLPSTFFGYIILYTFCCEYQRIWGRC